MILPLLFSSNNFGANTSEYFEAHSKFRKYHRNKHTFAVGCDKHHAKITVREQSLWIKLPWYDITLTDTFLIKKNI